MQCERPVTIDDPRYRPIYDRFGQNIYKIQVPCRSCAACQANHRKMWFFRLKVESNKCISSFCVTLTYNECDIPEYVPDSSGTFRYHPIKYSDVQLFNKRLRKALGPFRFFAVCEYGSEKLRPHYHICYFYDRPIDYQEFTNKVFDLWFPQTRITVDLTNDKACNYILKYCLKDVDTATDKEFWPKIHCSTKPFIGAGLLDDEQFLRWLHVTKSDISSYVGYKQRLPRIFRDRIFSDEEKKFFFEELGRLQKQRIDDKLAFVDSKIQKYGVEKGLEYIQYEREAFNSKVRTIKKMKSIK